MTSKTVQRALEKSSNRLHEREVDAAVAAATNFSTIVATINPSMLTQIRTAEPTTTTSLLQKTLENQPKQKNPTPNNKHNGGLFIQNNQF